MSGVDMRFPIGNVPVIPSARLWRHSHGLPAPREPEYRGGAIAPAPALTLEGMARQLAADPEFREWRGAEFLAELSAKTREALR